MFNDVFVIPFIHESACDTSNEDIADSPSSSWHLLLLVRDRFRELKTSKLSENTHLFVKGLETMFGKSRMTRRNYAKES